MYNLIHTGIVVKDMAESVDFYTKVLNCEVVGQHQDDHVSLTFLSTGNQGIELLKFAGDTEERKEGVINHFAFAVQDMELEIQRLKDLGVSLFTDQPREVMGGMKIFFFNGPSGEMIEFVQEPK